MPHIVEIFPPKVEVLPVPLHSAHVVELKS